MSGKKFYLAGFGLNPVSAVRNALQLEMTARPRLGLKRVMTRLRKRLARKAEMKE
jgi:hypothetical protein